MSEALDPYKVLEEIRHYNEEYYQQFSHSALPLGLAFDDVLLLPGYSEVRRREVDVSTWLTEKIKLSIPFVSSPMDTVTEAELAIGLGKVGGFGIIHRNLSIEKHVRQVKRVKKAGLYIGAAVGVGTDLKDRVEKLVDAGVDALCVDSGHGLSKSVIDATQWIHTNFPQVQLISGNVATPEGVKRLAEAGADAIRVGMGPGSICTTRVISGMGVPQFTAIQECAKEAKQVSRRLTQSRTPRGAGKHHIKVIADGGVKFSGDAVKALVAGADTVMMGSIFAATEEAPGHIVERNAKRYKYYRGMGSIKAMKEGSASRYGQENSLDEKKLVAEGVEGLVELKGTVAELMHQFVGGLRAGMYYVGAKNLVGLRKKARLIQITPPSLGESHPHSIVITNSGEL